MPPDLFQWASPGVFIGVSAWFALSILCEKSEKVANTFGRFGRWLRARAIKGGPPGYEHLHQEIADLTATVKRQREDMNAQDVKMDRQEIKITKLELTEEVNAVRQDMTTEYMREITLWYADAVVWAAENRLRLPPQRPFTEFVREYREKHGIQIRPPKDPPTRRSST
jgi:hypothetical protein